MRAIRKTIFTTFAISAGDRRHGHSGYGPVRRQRLGIRDVVRRIQTRTDSLQRAVQNAADRNNYRVDDIDRLILDFESAANQLDRRLYFASQRVQQTQTLLDRGAQIDTFFVNNRLGAGSRREWQAIRSDLDQLAGYYNLTPRWSWRRRHQRRK